MKRLAWLCTILSIVLFTTIAVAGDVTLRWDDPRPDGYRIFAAEVGNPMDYATPAAEVLATETEVTIPLDDTKAWWIVARAFKGAVESEDSRIVVYNPQGSVIEDGLNPPNLQ